MQTKRQQVLSLCTLILVFGWMSNGRCDILSKPIPVNVTNALSSRYHAKSGVVRIGFDSQDIVRNPLPIPGQFPGDYSTYNHSLAVTGKDYRGEKIEPGDYDLYVKVAPVSEQNKKLLIEVGLADSLSYIYYANPKKSQWIGPVRLKPSTVTDAIEYRGWDTVNLEQFLIVKHGEKPAITPEAIPNIKKDGWQTLWIDVAKFPPWFIESAKVSVRIRCGASYSVEKEAKIECLILDYNHENVTKFGWTNPIIPDQWQEHVIPLPQKFGPYLLRFFVTLPDGTKSEFQRIVARISSPQEFMSDIFCGHSSFALLKQMGAAWNRQWDCRNEVFTWALAEPEKGKFKWYDERLPKPPLKIIAVLESKGPKWLKGSVYDNKNAWLNYVRKVVTHYKGKIAAYEIFNEPWNHTASQEERRKHIELVNATVKVIRECDSEALTLTGGPTQEQKRPLEWWKNMKDMGLFDNVDIIASHLYFGAGGTHPIDQDLRWDAYVQALKKLLNSGKTKDKPLWDTESGMSPMESFYIGRQVTYGYWTTVFNPYRPVPYRTAAAMMARYIMLHFWHNVRWSYYHTWRAYGNSWALCDWDYTPLPAAVAAAQTTRLLDHSLPDGKPILPEGLWGLKFKKNNQSIITMWSVRLKRGETRFIKLPNSDIKVFDMFHNPINASKKIEIGIAPIILIGTEKAISDSIKNMSVESEIDKTASEQARKEFRLTAKDYSPSAKLKSSSTQKGYSLEAIRNNTTVSTGKPEDSWSPEPSQISWVEYQWPTPQEINSIICSFSPSTAEFQYQVEWYDGNVWRPCSATPGFRTPQVDTEEFTISTVKTTRLRMRLHSLDKQPIKIAEFDAYYFPLLTKENTEMPEEFTKQFKPSSKGYIKDWLICGPFPSAGDRYTQIKPSNWDKDLLRSCWIYGFGPGEKGLRPKVGQEHVAYFGRADDTVWARMNVRVAWLPYHFEKDYVDLSKCFKNNLITPEGHKVEHCIGYAVCYIYNPREIDGYLSIGSDDGYKIWLDDKIIAKQIVYRGASPDQEKYPIKIKPGLHRILVKLHNDIGGHGFYLRFLNKDLKPIRNYLVTIVPR